MSLYVLNTAVDFWAAIAAIDALTEADVDGSVEESILGTPISLTTTFEDFGSAGIELVVVESYLSGTTSFTVTDTTSGGLFPTVLYQFTMTEPLTIDGGFNLFAAASNITETDPDYISYDAGSVIRGFSASRDEMIGEGRFLGLGSSDKIELEYLSGQVGSDDRSIAIGGGGRDILKAAVLNSAIKGGGGADTIVVEFGRSKLVGDNGADEFIFDNGFWDDNGNPDFADLNSRVVIKDFVSGTDTIVFASVDPTVDTPSGIERTPLDDLVAGADLSTVADFTLDGVQFRFREQADGDAVLIRQGTDSAGRSYDERIVVEGLGLADIAVSDLNLQDYLADTYEFFQDDPFALA